MNLGNRTQRDPEEMNKQRRHRIADSYKGKMTRRQCPEFISTQLGRIALWDDRAVFDQRTRDVRSRMREIRTSGSVGAREGDLPWLPDQCVFVDCRSQVKDVVLSS
jgi:hypothetical protein